MAIWDLIKEQSAQLPKEHPLMQDYLNRSIDQQPGFDAALSHILGKALETPDRQPINFTQLFSALCVSQPEIARMAALDLEKLVKMNPEACPTHLNCAVIGDIEVGAYAMVGAKSLVLNPVAPGDIVAGIPAKIVGTHPKAGAKII